MDQIKIGSGGRNKKKNEPRAKPRPRGRPPKPTDEKLNHKVAGYLDRATFRAFNKAVRSLKYSSAEAVREAVMFWIQELDNQRGIA